MQKPNDFEVVQAYAGFSPLAPGGHICKIMNVEETKSRAGRDMVVISIDTDKTDSQPEYFTDQYKNNQKPNKKWSNNAIVRQLILAAEGGTNRGFKTFIDTVEKSNQGFKVQWGNNFATCLKGKLIGGVFGKEEYMNDSTGECKFATKFQNFRTVEEIKNGVEVPKDKLLNPGASASNNSFNDGGFGDELIPVDGGDLPF